MARRPFDPDIAVRLGTRIRAVREAAGLSQQAVADRICAAAPTISRFESGDVMPTVTTLVALGKVLGVPASVFLDFASPVSPSAADAEETSLLEQFRQLPLRYRSVVRGLIAAILNAE